MFVTEALMLLAILQWQGVIRVDWFAVGACVCCVVLLNWWRFQQG